MAKRQKSEKQLANEAITLQFQSMPIDEWLDYISANAEDEEQIHTYKVCARRALSIANMKEYILKHDNNAKAKSAFKASTYYTTTDKDGKEVERQSIFKAAEYFIATYIPDLKVEPKAKSGGAFDEIADW